MAPGAAMNGARVLLMSLSQRTSAKNTEYLSGYLGKARVVGFRGKEPDKFGNPTWDIFVAEPEPKAEQTAGFRGDRARRPPSAAQTARAIARAEPPPLDDTEAALRDFDERYGGGK
jgi:hypothetical protein